MGEMNARRHVGRVIDRSVRIAAPAHDVYEAWADPLRFAQWFVDRAEGRATAGTCMTWVFDAFRYSFPVPVVETVPDRKIVFAGEIPGRLPFIQEILIDEAAGVTTLRLINSGYAESAGAQEEFDGVDSGWTMALAVLKEWLERHAKRRTRTHGLFMEPAGFTNLRQAGNHFFSISELRRWFCPNVVSSLEGLEAGGEFWGTLGTAGPITARVLACSSFEMTVSWLEQNGTLTFKAIANGPAGRCLAFDFNAWNDEAVVTTAIEHELVGALRRLVKTA